MGAERIIAALQSRWGARLVETHISWLLLAADRAWKFKKPVRLGFLDFRDLQARRRMCEEELRLNRRLAPSLYLDVVPIGGTPDDPLPGGEPAIEHALRMRRFPDGALLSGRVADGSITHDVIDRLADRLAAFHRDAPRAAAGSGFGTPSRIAADLRAVVAGLARRGGPGGAADWTPWVDEQVQRLSGEWQRRLDAGMVREGHGDLHLANLLLLDGEPTAFDCIEFDPGLRWIDVQADIAFLLMDLAAHGRRDLAFRCLDRWLAGLDDVAGVAVLRPYLVYRALVRALVSRLAPRPQPGPGHDYLAQALQWREPAGARLLLTHGVSGSGKSHLAGLLLERAGAIRLRSDVERKRLFGLAPLQASPRQAPDGIYGPEATQRTYRRLLDGAADALRAGWPVIVDAACLRRDEREAFGSMARRLRVPMTLLHCDGPDDLLRTRMAERQRRADDPSEADAGVLALQRRVQQPLAPGELARAIVVDARQPVDADALAARWLAAR